MVGADPRVRTADPQGWREEHLELKVVLQAWEEEYPVQTVVLQAWEEEYPV